MKSYRRHEAAYQARHSTAQKKYVAKEVKKEEKKLEKKVEKKLMGKINVEYKHRRRTPPSRMKMPEGQIHSMNTPITKVGVPRYDRFARPKIP